ncbi:hypothetical protein HMPREF1624_02662 [Sporothrix schenckii ATCC 58251]|uniref:Major facilitator superfamily (MFS) profile domain-containing protein n=1 Tax=Sporothrix schenckii (strain ATCC 58251 / de Perez 2211183) TaxID=1391915 RepID=U7Q400_SPOS1|nr:hypothetical protein HMPREF1624_02662 [Sporothrix schenckii ATCC 58251]
MAPDTEKSERPPSPKTDITSDGIDNDNTVDYTQDDNTPTARPPSPSPTAMDKNALQLRPVRSTASSRQHCNPPISHDTPVEFADGHADHGGDDDGGDDDDDDDAAMDGYNDAEKLPYSKWRCIALVATVTGATFTNTLSVQSVVIILPSVGRDLNIPDTRLQWIVSAYSLAFGCFLLLWGRIADVFGKKAIFVAGSAWVTATTVANPFIPNEIVFNLFRGLQGLGAAANVPTAIGILGTTFPPGKAKNYAFAAYGAGAPLGSVFGNLMAGLITSYANWKWVFGALAILSGIVTVVGYLIIPAQPPPQTVIPVRAVDATATAPATADANDSTSPSVALSAVPVPATFRSIDWFGAFLVTLGLVGLLFALTEGNVVGWSTPWIGVIIGLSLLLVAAFVGWQMWLETPSNVRKQIAGHAWPPRPLVRMSIFSRSAGGGLFATSLVIMGLFFSSFMGYLVYATYLFQDYLGLSAIQTTLRFIPTGIAGIITCFCVAPLLGRVPTYWILLFGNASVSISSLLLAVPIPFRTTSYFAYGLEAMVLSVMGADTAWPSLTLFVSHALPREDQALGGALVNMAGQVGRAIGLAIATAIQTAVMASARGVSVANVGGTKVDDEPTLRGLRAANWFNFALGVCSFLVVLVAFRSSGVIGSNGKPPAQPLRVEVATRSSSSPSSPEQAVDVEKGLSTGATRRTPTVAET